jgi:uncharacterized protein YndB with AHSA1/START domain
MLSFDVVDRSEAPPIEVWKLLYDPSRFPDWWVGIETVEMTSAETFTYFAPGYPDFPMPQALQASPTDHRVKISCLVSDLRFEWQLAPLEDGTGTSISVHVEIPDREAHRLATQQDVILRSVARLARLAARG